MTVTDITTAEAVIRLTAVYVGATQTMDVKVRRNLAPPPVTGTGGSGTSATDSTLSTVSSNSMVVVSDELTVTTGSAGQVALSAPLSFYVADGGAGGTFGLFGVWQRWNGSAWVDVGSEVAHSASATLDYFEYFPMANEGTIVVNSTATGLGSGVSVKFRLMCRTSSGTRPHSLIGTASATGS
jgi:hypothetical protein